MQKRPGIIVFRDAVPGPKTPKRMSSVFMKRVFAGLCIMLAACLLVAFTACSQAGAAPASSSAQPPAPAASAPAQSGPSVKVVRPEGASSSSQPDPSSQPTSSSKPKETKPPPAPVPYEGGTVPAGNAQALEGAWHYYEDPEALAAGEATTAFQVRFFGEATKLTFNYGEFGSAIGVYMLGTYAVAGDGTVTLTDATWSAQADETGAPGGSATFAAAWPTDGSDGLVLTLLAYQTSTGEDIDAFERIFGVPMLYQKYGETQIVF